MELAAQDPQPPGDLEQSQKWGRIIVIIKQKLDEPLRR